MLTEAWRGWGRAGDKSEWANCRTVECAVGGEIGCGCGLVQSRWVSWFAEARFWVDGAARRQSFPFFANFVLTRSCTLRRGKFDAELDPPGGGT